MLRYVSVLLCVLLLVGTVGARVLQRDGRPAGRDPEHRRGFIELKRELDLTEVQLERLRGIGVEYQRTRIAARAELASKRLDLVEMLRTTEPSRSEIEQKVREMGRLRTELQLGRVHAILEARNVLTPEQLQKFHSLGVPMKALLPMQERGRCRQ